MRARARRPPWPAGRLSRRRRRRTSGSCSTPSRGRSARSGSGRGGSASRSVARSAGASSPADRTYTPQNGVRSALANRLLAYRVALELQQRRGGRRGRDPSFRLAEIGERLLRCLVRHQVDRRADDDSASWDDYQLAGRAGVSVRQTRELYEEIGLGGLVREALDLLEERGLVSIARKSP